MLHSTSAQIRVPTSWPPPAVGPNPDAVDRSLPRASPTRPTSAARHRLQPSAKESVPTEYIVVKAKVLTVRLKKLWPFALAAPAREDSPLAGLLPEHILSQGSQPGNPRSRVGRGGPCAPMIRSRLASAKTDAGPAHGPIMPSPRDGPAERDLRRSRGGSAVPGRSTGRSRSGAVLKPNRDATGLSDLPMPAQAAGRRSRQNAVIARSARAPCAIGRRAVVSGRAAARPLQPSPRQH